jgi:hypothetical protein
VTSPEPGTPSLDDYKEATLTHLREALLVGESDLETIQRVKDVSSFEELVSVIDTALNPIPISPRIRDKLENLARFIEVQLPK